MLLWSTRTALDCSSSFWYLLQVQHRQQASTSLLLDTIVPSRTYFLPRYPLQRAWNFMRISVSFISRSSSKCAKTPVLKNTLEWPILYNWVSKSKNSSYKNTRTQGHILPHGMRHQMQFNHTIFCAAFFPSIKPFGIAPGVRISYLPSKVHISEELISIWHICPTQWVQTTSWSKSGTHIAHHTVIAVGWILAEISYTWHKHTSRSTLNFSSFL